MTALPADLDTALHRFAAAGQVLVALDFDGCLAPIVEDPSAARALPGSDAALRALSRRQGVRLALVSGRALADLRAVADPPPDVVLVASHGAEVAGADGPDVPPHVLERVASALEAVVREHPGTALEHKPAGVVLHTRRAPRAVAREATAAALRAVSDVEGAHVLQGKEVVEVSVVEADKGTALLELAGTVGADAVLYAGDDVTDEHAFTALDRRAVDADVTVKVGDGDTAARYRVDGPAAVTDILERLLALRG